MFRITVVMCFSFSGMYFMDLGVYFVKLFFKFCIPYEEKSRGACFCLLFRFHIVRLFVCL